jgi:hypothetical protein
MGKIVLLQLPQRGRRAAAAVAPFSTREPTRFVGHRLPPAAVHSAAHGADPVDHADAFDGPPACFVTVPPRRTARGGQCSPQVTQATSFTGELQRRELGGKGNA